MEITLGSRWKQADTVMKVVQLTSDGEVGYRIADKPPKANGDGVMGEWADHHCTVENFLAQHTPVVEVTSPAVASAAGELLADPETPPEVKRVAASALTQAPDKVPPIPAPTGKKGKGR